MTLITCLRKCLSGFVCQGFFPSPSAFAYWTLWKAITMGFPDGSESARCRRRGFDSWVGKIPWRRKWQPTPVLLPGKFYELRSLIGYSPWGRKESDTTERLHFTSLVLLLSQETVILNNLLFLTKLTGKKLFSKFTGQNTELVLSWVFKAIVGLGWHLEKKLILTFCFTYRSC